MSSFSWIMAHIFCPDRFDGQFCLGILGTVAHKFDVSASAEHFWLNRLNSRLQSNVQFLNRLNSGCIFGCNQIRCTSQHTKIEVTMTSSDIVKNSCERFHLNQIRFESFRIFFWGKVFLSQTLKISDPPAKTLGKESWLNTRRSWPPSKVVKSSPSPHRPGLWSPTLGSIQLCFSQLCLARPKQKANQSLKKMMNIKMLTDLDYRVGHPTKSDWRQKTEKKSMKQNRCLGETVEFPLKFRFGFIRWRCPWSTMLQPILPLKGYVFALDASPSSTRDPLAQDFV